MINRLDRPHKSLRSVEQTVTVLVVENSVVRQKINVRAESSLIPGSNFLFPGDLQDKVERKCAWCLEMTSKLAEVILQRENWNLF